MAMTFFSDFFRVARHRAAVAIGGETGSFQLSHASDVKSVPWSQNRPQLLQPENLCASWWPGAAMPEIISSAEPPFILPRNRKTFGWALRIWLVDFASLDASSATHSTILAGCLLTTIDWDILRSRVAAIPGGLRDLVPRPCSTRIARGAVEQIL